MPPLIVRRASTTIELRDGQSFVIGGSAAKRRPERAASSCPGSATCRCSARCSAARPTRRTRPTSPSSSRRASCGRRGPATSIKTPLDNTLPANDVDLFLMGKTESHAGRCAARARRHAGTNSPATSSICRREAPMSSQSATKASACAAAALLAAPCSAAARTSTTTGATRSRSAPAMRSPPTG